jgi:hypothetical protein
MTVIGMNSRRNIVAYYEKRNTVYSVLAGFAMTGRPIFVGCNSVKRIEAIVREGVYNNFQAHG